MEVGANTARGKELFVQKCASCHTLADAGAKGTIGPDLDAAFRRAREDGFGESTIRDVVRGQIAYPIKQTPTGEPGMPANLVTGEDADAVATYVALVAGIGPEAPPGAVAAGGAQDPTSIFVSKCASCHILADAGTKGTIGPNLDQAKPSVAEAVRQITSGGGGMPPFKGQLSEAEIRALAKYVASVAGR